MTTNICGLTIGFDGKRAVRNMTGLGNYSRLVLSSLAEAYPQMQLQVYTPRDDDNDRWNKVRSLHNIRIRLPEGKGATIFGGALWRTQGISKQLRAEGVQLYHGLSNELPINISSSGVPSVVTMHDVIYRRLPYCYKPIDRAIYDFKYGKSCRNATRIIAVSECTKRDVMEYYGVPEEKIDVVYQGCDDIFKEHWTTERLLKIKEKYGLLKPYIIQVGSIEKRKNALLTVKALSGMTEDIELVLVGRGTDYLKDIEKCAVELGVRGRIKVLSGVSFADLPGLYQGASVAAYPSRYEGFGIPVLEALCSCTPCVAATGSCLEEAGGNGALYVDADDAQGLQGAISALMNDSSLRNSLCANGLKHAAHFDNKDIPARIMEVYQKILRYEGCR
ncbi:MAG: glycosyltransferase family 4 protein [Muribaculaceae bacterium]|nr:glycosyltransferase family 4 protein [Muribaculaceae bacterium]